MELWSECSQQRSQFFTSASAWRSLCRKRATLSSFYPYYCANSYLLNPQGQGLYTELLLQSLQRASADRGMFCWPKHRLPLDRGFFYLQLLWPRRLASHRLWYSLNIKDKTPYLNIRNEKHKSMYFSSNFSLSVCSTSGHLVWYHRPLNQKKWTYS